MTPGGGFYVGEWAANERNGYGLEITPGTLPHACAAPKVVHQLTHTSVFLHATDGDVYQGHFLGGTSRSNNI